MRWGRSTPCSFHVVPFPKRCGECDIGGHARLRSRRPRRRQRLSPQVDFPLGQNKHASPGMLYGMALTSDGTRLYLANGGHDPVDASLPSAMHYNTIQVFDIVGTPPTLQENTQLGPLKLMFANDSQRV